MDVLERLFPDLTDEDYINLYKGSFLDKLLFLVSSEKDNIQDHTDKNDDIVTFLQKFENELTEIYNKYNEENKKIFGENSNMATEITAQVMDLHLAIDDLINWDDNFKPSNMMYFDDYPIATRTYTSYENKLIKAENGIYKKTDELENDMDKIVEVFSKLFSSLNK